MHTYIIIPIEPIPNVMITSPTTQIVGHLVTLECSVTTVRGIGQWQCHTWCDRLVWFEGFLLYTYVFSISIVPSFEITILQNGSASFNDSFTLDCVVTMLNIVDSSSVMFSWVGPEGNIIANDSRVIISPITHSGNTYTSSIQFNPIMEEDEGTYTCNVIIFETNGSASVILGALACKSSVTATKWLFMSYVMSNYGVTVTW